MFHWVNRATRTMMRLPHSAFFVIITVNLATLMGNFNSAVFIIKYYYFLFQVSFREFLPCFKRSMILSKLHQNWVNISLFLSARCSPPLDIGLDRGPWCSFGEPKEHQGAQSVAYASNCPQPSYVSRPAIWTEGVLYYVCQDPVSHFKMRLLQRFSVLRHMWTAYCHFNLQTFWANSIILVNIYKYKSFRLKCGLG